MTTKLYCVNLYWLLVIYDWGELQVVADAQLPDLIKFELYTLFECSALLHLPLQPVDINSHSILLETIL